MLPSPQKPMVLRAAAAFLGELARVLCPDRCLACGVLLPPSAPGKGIAAGPAAALSGALCERCTADVRPVAGPLCPSCGAAFASPEGPDHLCEDCMDRDNHFFRSRAGAFYEGAAAEAVKRYKYGKNLWMAGPLSRLLEEACARHYPGEAFDLVAPVPLFPARLRWRGFNQVQAMLVCWRKRGTMPGPPAPVLLRIRATQPQAGLGGPERARNVKGAFRVAVEEEVKGRSVLLVDDVYTTGATVREAARTLLSAGAARVDVLTLVRVRDR